MNALRHNSSGTYLLAGCADGSVQLWNTKNKNHVTTFASEHNKDILDISVGPNDAFFATGSKDRHVVVWDTNKGSLVTRFSDHYDRVNSVHIPSYSNDIVFSASYDGTAKAWDMRSRSKRPIQTFKAKDSINSVISVPGYVATASSDGCLRLYDVRNGQLSTTTVCDAAIAYMTPTLSSPYSVALSTTDATLRLVDLMSGTELDSYQGHAHSAQGLQSSFYDNDSHIVTASEDGHLYYWSLDGSSGNCHVTEGAITALSVDNRKETTHLAVAVDGRITWIDRNELAVSGSLP